MAAWKRDSLLSTLVYSYNAIVNVENKIQPSSTTQLITGNNRALQHLTTTYNHEEAVSPKNIVVSLQRAPDTFVRSGAPRATWEIAY